MATESRNDTELWILVIPLLAGSFAVICLMTGKVVSQYSGQVQALALGNGTAPAVLELPIYSPLEVATAVTFMVAIYQVSLLFWFPFVNSKCWVVQVYIYI